MKSNPQKNDSNASIFRSDIQRSLNSQFDENQSIEFFHYVNEFDKTTNKICRCQPYSGNRNDLINDVDNSHPQIYADMRKIYNEDTDLLEHVYIIMSTTKPKYSIDQYEEETIAERRRRRTRISKQRAKRLITECCARKLVDNIKIHSNKRIIW